MIDFLECIEKFNVKDIITSEELCKEIAKYSNEDSNIRYFSATAINKLNGAELFGFIEFLNDYCRLWIDANIKDSKVIMYYTDVDFFETKINKVCTKLENIYKLKVLW
jgi:hypothetical protein